MYQNETRSIPPPTYDFEVIVLVTHCAVTHRVKSYLPGTSFACYVYELAVKTQHLVLNHTLSTKAYISGAISVWP